MRRTWWISLLVLVVILGALAAGAYALLAYEPSFYTSAVQADGPQREQTSHDFENRLFALMSDFSSARFWKFSCTSDQLNAYLAEGFLNTGPAKLFPKQIHDLRVRFEQDEVQVGFKYGHGELQTIISLKVRVWLPQKEPSTLVLEVLSFQAGMMPLAIKALQEELTEELRSQNIKALWYRKDGHPTAVLRFQADRREPSFHFRRLELRPGQLYIEGITLDPEAPKRAVEGIAGTP
jgi:hypothetical protein